MSAQPKSAIGKLADLEEGQIALSGFIVQRDSGLYVQLSRLERPGDFLGFVDRVVEAGLYFRGLDYPQFVLLLYGDPLGRCEAATDEVFLAADITAFRPARRLFYQGWAIAHDEAAYLFEPLYGEANGDQTTGDESHRTGFGDGSPGGETRIHLDLDEFIVSAWEHGVRFGIDVAVVREGFAVDKPERRVVARARPFAPGKDAEIIEQAPGLHRNDAPRRLLGNRVDLRQFETRYPQVSAGVRLVRKTARTLGADGRGVSGEVLPAPLPRDLELQALAGPGTHVSQEKDGEYLLASVCGFLDIDRRSNQFSVVDKIVSHEGVSTRTTGDLVLTGEEYEQHGEIQEKRIVECRSITAYADVFGRIVSSGGLVHLKHNLVGGSASNEAGDIVVEGMASGSTLIARHGCVRVQRADNCVIIGRQVFIGQAWNCDIVGEEVKLDVGESCALAGKTVHLRRARSRREVGNALLVLVPDLSGHDKQIAAAQAKLTASEQVLDGYRARIEALRGESDVGKYLLLAGQLRRQELTLTPAQQAGWRRLSALVAPSLRSLSQLADFVKEQGAESAALSTRIDELLASREDLCSGLACTIDRIEGDTRVSSLLLRLAEPPLNELPSKDLKARLRRTDTATKLLFSGAAGNFSWTYPGSSS